MAQGIRRKAQGRARKGGIEHRRTSPPRLEAKPMAGLSSDLYFEP